VAGWSGCAAGFGAGGASVFAGVGCCCMGWAAVRTGDGKLPDFSSGVLSVENLLAPAKFLEAI
jgi:predicted RNase H-like nuclease